MGENGKMMQPPKGMMRVGSVTNAPWFEMVEDNVLFGDLLNVFERPDERSPTKKSKFYQVELKQKCLVRRGRGDDAGVEEAKVGEVVNLNYGPKTKDFEVFVPHLVRGAKYDVYVGVTGKKFSIGKGRTMWPLDCRAVQTQAEQAMDEPDFTGSGGDEGGEASASAAG